MTTTITREPTLTTLEDAYYWWADFEAAQSQFEDTEERLSHWCDEEGQMAANVLAFRPMTATDFARLVRVCRFGDEFDGRRLDKLEMWALPFL
jgi:hypothetical protein